MHVLGIEVDALLRRRWSKWFAPEVQPFVVADSLRAKIGPVGIARDLPAELLDTYELYGMPEDRELVWLDEPTFMAMNRRDRSLLVRAQVDLGRAVVPSVRRWEAALGRRVRDQADGHRFVWWPSLLAGHEDAVLGPFVDNGRPPSRHREISGDVWDDVSELLPGARSSAGRFPVASGPNCFGAVMAAAGVDGPDGVWTRTAPFDEWLDGATRPGGRDGEAGTVFVWCNGDGLAEHAAITLGGGWALHKPSQGWMSPTSVLAVDDLKRTSRVVGLRLHRSTLSSHTSRRSARARPGA